MKKLHRNSALRFLLLFVLLYVVFYYGNIVFFSLSSQGRHYCPFVDLHLNYIRGLRHLLLNLSGFIINLFGYTCINNDQQLLVAGHGIIDVVYSCLGLDIMSGLAAFVLAYPKTPKSKLIFLVIGLISIQLLNVLRFVLLAVFWDKKSTIIFDHHTIFNIVVYVLIAVSIYFWVKNKKTDQPVSPQSL